MSQNIFGNFYNVLTLIKNEYLRPLTENELAQLLIDSEYIRPLIGNEYIYYPQESKLIFNNSQRIVKLLI